MSTSNPADSRRRFAQCVTGVCLLAGGVQAKAATGFIDEFIDVKAWCANNANAPAKFSSDGKILTLIDPPGGEATWGTSISRGPVSVDLTETPYLIARVIETTGAFAVKLVSRKTKDKHSATVTVRRPGLMVANVAERLNCAGKTSLTIGLYVLGREKMAKVDYVKFADRLTAKEKKAMDRMLAQHPKKYHGLTELATRRGWRDLGHVRRGKTYLSERTVFRDSSTGAPAWRMTCDPGIDKGDYYDIPAWNADGSLITFLSKRGGRSGRWLMNAKGGSLRPFIGVDGRSIGWGVWSVRYPDRFYGAVVNKGRTHVVAYDPRTGRHQVVVSVEQENLGTMYPPHPSEKWFLFGRRVRKGKAGSPDDPSEAHVVGLDGSVRTIRFERRWHRLRFTKSPDAQIFFNFEKPRTQWTILPDGSDRTRIPKPGGHPDWMPGGTEMTFYAEGKIWAVHRDGTGLRCMATLKGGGHGGPCLDGEWFVSDTTRRGEFPDSILILRTDGSQTIIPVFRHMSSYLGHSVRWHPGQDATHPHPVSSPDGTKILCNSDFLGQYADVYVSVARMPDPPRDLAAQRDGDHVRLTWQRPRRSRETHGYVVYRSDRSGLGYRRVTDKPITVPEWRGPDASTPGFYVVTAVEHSGLESAPSNEVCDAGGGHWQGAARVFIEAEAGRPTVPMREGGDFPTASNAYYVGSVEGKPGGNLALDVVVPKEGNYHLWARIQDTGTLTVACNGRQHGTLSCEAVTWTWRKLASVMTLAAGRHALRFESKEGGEQIDKLLLTDDAGFEPYGAGAIDTTPPDAPTHLKAVLVSNNALHLTWSVVRATDVDHYNVYCGTKPDLACDQGALVGSPAETEMVDWGLGPNEARWYKVTAVDRAGNESPTSKAVAARTPPFNPVHIVLEANRARTRQMKLVASKEAGGQVLRAIKPAPLAEATWTFDLPRDVTGAIWARLLGTEETPAHCMLRIDHDARISLRSTSRWGEWGWSPAGRKVGCSPELFRLKAGKHTLRLQPRNAGAQIAEIVITEDPRFGAKGPGE